MSLNQLYKLFVSLVSIFVLIPVLFVPTLSSNIFQIPDNESHQFILNENSLTWPIPGYMKISSYFGKRSSPTKHASSFHQGVDIPAPAGTNLVATADSIVTYIGFNGSGGYSIHLKSNHFEFIYHHVSPNYIISPKQTVKAGQLIGKVGPKNVYNVKNNPYKDSSGKPTNGATTGPHLHFTIKKDGKAVNPLNYF